MINFCSKGTLCILMVLDRKFSVAPMLDWTTRHTRYFFRLFSQRMLQYTEMVTTGALIHGDQSRFLTHRIEEYPLAIQLGGSNPAELAYCTELSNRAGFQDPHTILPAVGRLDCIWAVC